MNVFKIVTLTLVILTTSVLAVSAQTNGALKEVETTDRENTGEAVIKYDNKKKAGAVPQATKAEVKTADSSFKKKKTTIDKAKMKLDQLKSKFSLKKETGQWTNEKYQNMMTKIKKKELKIDQKKQDLIKSLSTKK